MDFSSLTADFLENEKIILRWMAVGMMVLGALTFLILQCLQAPYGRYGNKAWGFELNGKVAWFVQELPSIAVPVSILLFTEGKTLDNTANKILCSMFIIHYIHRALVFPFLIKGGKPTPFTPFFLAFLFCLYNGYMQGRYITNFAQYPTNWVMEPHFLLGVLMFFFGMSINIHSDHVLRNLRKPGEAGYKIPKGGMFEYISGANFFGEILEWSGFALASWNLPATAFMMFTACNIGPRALHHHRWYTEKFRSDYPRHRRALIPYVL